MSATNPDEPRRPEVPRSDPPKARSSPREAGASSHPPTGCGFVQLVDLTVLAVQGRFDDLAQLRTRHPELAGPEGREALLQVHLFAGFPRVVEAFQVLDRVGGMGRAEPAEVRAEPSLPERGRGLFQRIYGSGTERVEAILQDAHPDLADWVLGHAYGRVLTRPGLEPRERELLAVAALAASHQDRQLASHVRGAVACGATRSDLEGILERLVPHLEAEAHERSAAVIARFALPPGR